MSAMLIPPALSLNGIFQQDPSVPEDGTPDLDISIQRAWSTFDRIVRQSTFPHLDEDISALTEIAELCRAASDLWAKSVLFCAYLQIISGKSDDAIEPLGRVIGDHHFEDARLQAGAIMMYGVAQGLCGETELANSAMEEALNVDGLPFDTRATLVLFRCVHYWLPKQQLDRAINDLSFVLETTELNPTSEAVVRAYRSMAYCESGNSSAALKDLTVAQLLSDVDLVVVAALCVARADVHCRSGQYDEAIGELNKAGLIETLTGSMELQRASLLRKSHRKRAQRRSDAGDFRSAVDDLTVALDLVGESVGIRVDVLIDRAVNLYDSGEVDAAFSDLQSAVRLAEEVADDDMSAAALLVRARIKRMEGDVQGAIEDCDAMAGLASIPPDLRWEALIERGKARTGISFEAAIEDFVAAEGVGGIADDKVALARQIQGYCWREIGDSDTAIDLWLRAIRTPDYNEEFKAEAIGWLEELGVTVDADGTVVEAKGRASEPDVAVGDEEGVRDADDRGRLAADAPVVANFSEGVAEKSDAAGEHSGSIPQRKSFGEVDEDDGIAVGRISSSFGATARHSGVAEEAEELRRELAPAMSSDQLQRLTEVIRAAQSNPPSGREAKQRLAEDVNRVLIAQGLRLRAGENVGLLLRVVPGSTGDGSFQLFSDPSASGGGIRCDFRAVSIESIEVPDYSAAEKERGSEAAVGSTRSSGATLLKSLSELDAELPSRASAEQIRALEAVIAAAQEEPPNDLKGKQAFVRGVNRLLDGLSVRLSVDGELYRLAVNAAASRTGTIQFKASGRSRGGFSGKRRKRVTVMPVEDHGLAKGRARFTPDP